VAVVFGVMGIFWTASFLLDAWKKVLDSLGAPAILEGAIEKLDTVSYPEDGETITQYVVQVADRRHLIEEKAWKQLGPGRIVRLHFTRGRRALIRIDLAGDP